MIHKFYNEFIKSLYLYMKKYKFGGKQSFVESRIYFVLLHGAYRCIQYLRCFATVLYDT